MYSALHNSVNTPNFFQRLNPDVTVTILLDAFTRDLLYEVEGLQCLVFGTYALVQDV